MQNVNKDGLERMAFLQQCNKAKYVFRQKH
jgi:hypothetical protein